MRTTLVVLTAFEIALVVAVLAVYLVKIGRSLQATAGYLGRTNFGVRAIESQCEPIGPSITRINRQLTTIGAALANVADEAERLTGEPIS
ncbi:MAG: hypothetical protein WD250_06260 [Egibacteraceae bacterium]